MTSPIKLSFKIYQGSTFKEVLRWESDTKVYKPITSISKAAPAEITSTAHGIPVGWRFKVSNVIGMKEINSSEIQHIASSTTVDTVTINSLNTLDYSAYTSGGVLEYAAPVDLSGFSARLQLRSKISSPEALLELTTENGGIILDSLLNTITIYISAAQTAELNFVSGVYSLDMIKSDEVTTLIEGSMALVKEITR